MPSLKCSCSQTLLVGYLLKLNAECNNNKQQTCFMAVYIHGSCVITSHLICGQSVSDCRVNVAVCESAQFAKCAAQFGRVSIGVMSGLGLERG